MLPAAADPAPQNDIHYSWVTLSRADIQAPPQPSPPSQAQQRSACAKNNYPRQPSN